MLSSDILTERLDTMTKELSWDKSFSKSFGKLIFVLLFVLSGCTSMTMDMSVIEGMEPTAFSEEKFAKGEFRFGVGGSKIFDGRINQAITERRFEDALDELVKADRAFDQSYYNLGIIAENMGLYIAASEYFSVARELHLMKGTVVSRCPYQENFFYGFYEQSCFMIGEVEMTEAIKRNQLKDSGEWVDSVIEYENGKIYVGEINENGRPHGLGELTSPSGEFYYGRFLNGRQEGPGTLTIRTPSTNLYFRGVFKNGEPKDGYLYNPAMKTFGVPFGHEMTFKDGGFYYPYKGWGNFPDDPLGSRPRDNNYWFSGSWSEGLGSAIKQVFANGGTAPLFTDDPLISRVCSIKSDKLSSAAAKTDLCDNE